MGGADVLVLGGGHNGLAAAVRLARSGRRVVVVERRDRLGGLAAAEEIHPGYTVPGILHDDGRVPERLTRELGLAGHGLAFGAPSRVCSRSRRRRSPRPASGICSASAAAPWRCASWAAPG